MKIIRLTGVFVLKGLLAALIASALGVGYALITHSTITRLTFSSANLLIFVVMIISAGIISGSNRGCEEQLDKSMCKAPGKYSYIDDESMKKGVSLSLTLGGASVIPFLVWVVTYYLL